VGAVQAEIAELVADKKLDDARKVADQFVEKWHKDAERRVAGLKFPQGTDAAEVAKQKQQMIDYADMSVAYEMARGFSQAQAWDEAEARVKRVLDKHPEFGMAQMMLGDIYLGRQLWDKARSQYEKILKDRPNDFVAGNNLAWLLAVRFNDVDGAYKLVQQLRKGQFSGAAVPGDRMNAEFLDTLGVVLRKVNTPEALADMRDVFESARRRYPTDPRICLYLGCAYAGLQQNGKAQEMFNLALNLAGPKAKNGLSAEQRQGVVQEVEQARKQLKGA